MRINSHHEYNSASRLCLYDTKKGMIIYMNTLYITDLDGTLLQPNSELSTTTKRILNEKIEKGMNFSIATARTIASVKSIISDVNINLPIVLMNGVCIYDLTKEEYINVETLDTKSKNMLLDLIGTLNLNGFAYVIKEHQLSTYYVDITAKPLRSFYEERVTKYRKPFTKINNFSELANEPLIYFTLIDHKDNLDSVYEFIKDTPELNCVLYKDNYTTDTWYLEIYSKNASKYHGVHFMRNYLQPERIVCFGDNRNDIPLFRAADYKIAVANAVDELKLKSDTIIKSNAQDGVALWLMENGTLV